MNSKMVLLFIISFLFGLCVGNFFIDAEYLKLILISFVSVVFLFRYRILFSWRFFYLFLFSLLAVLFGIFRFFISFEGGEKHISNYLGDFELKGCIETEVDLRSNKVNYTVDVFSLNLDGEWIDVFGKVLISAGRYPVYRYGDCLLLSGELRLPKAIEGFAYDKYLSRYNVYVLMYKASISLLAEKRGSAFYRYIFLFKGAFERRLNKIYAEPHSSFMAGLILGSRKGIPAHLMEDFNTTGLTHIIAISGYNITLVIVIVSGLFSFLSRRLKVIASIVFVVVFVILVGASAAVVRAGIMGVISLMALWFGRQYYVVLGLFIAAFLMNLWNPKILVYDVGFQLSFLATCGLIFVSPLIEKYFSFLPKTLEIRESVLMTISAQILALPVIVFNFGRLSLISPLANLFVLPFLPFSMLFGFFAVVFSFLWNFLGNFVGFFGYLSLELIVFFVKFFAEIPFASINISWFDYLLFIFYYYFVLNWILKPRS